MFPIRGMICDDVFFRYYPLIFRRLCPPLQRSTSFMEGPQMAGKNNTLSLACQNLY